MSRSNAPIRRILFAAAACLAASVAPVAHAAWLGLPDGDDVVSLVCDASTVIPCPQTITGALSISGAGANSLDVTVDGKLFAGNPFKVDGTASVEVEYSRIAISPTAFVSLASITDGAFGPYGVGDRFWQYCSNIGPGTCVQGTVGHWSARAVGSVSAPAPISLLAAGLALIIGRRRNAAA
jgi:hypothetical protein